MSILYSQITWNDIPLVDFANQTGTFRRFCEYFNCVYTKDRIKSVYKYLNYNICVYITDILTYICITTPDFKNERSFDFLMKLHLQFHADFAEETQRYEQNMTFPLKFEMDKAFSFYIEHTMKLYNRTASEREIDYSFDDQDDSPIEEFVLDEEKTRSRIKTPLLVQSVYDIKSIDFGLTKVSSSRSIFISWLMKHSYISIAICVTVGLGSLVLVILKLLNKI